MEITVTLSFQTTTDAESWRQTFIAAADACGDAADHAGSDETAESWRNDKRRLREVAEKIQVASVWRREP
jgi:hypothetical protein